MNCRAVTVDVGTRLWPELIVCRAAAQLLQDAAVRARFDGLALRAQFAQLSLKNSQFLNPTRDMADVLVEHGIHVAAMGARRILERQQHADFIQRHVE